MTKDEKIKKILKEEQIIFNTPKINNKIIVIKDFFKQNQFFYCVIMSLLFPIGFNFYYSRRIFKYLSKDKIIVNLGSGNKVIDDSIINLDLYKYDNVDVAGDIENLPFKDKSIDGVINECTLEHLINPNQAIKEMSRVLKKEGILCLSAPFMFYYHESPDDYYRWTKSGLKLILEKNNLEIIKFVNLGGPAGALYLSLAQFLAIALSFNVNFLYYFFSYLFLLILWPIQIFDFIFSKFKMASNNSAIFLLFARKK